MSDSFQPIRGGSAILRACREVIDDFDDEELERYEGTTYDGITNRHKGESVDDFFDRVEDEEDEMSVYRHRTFCDACEELRQQVKKLTVFNVFYARSIMQSLVEELQTSGNRMEAGLYYGQDLQKLHTKAKRLQKKVGRLKKEAAALESKKPTEEELLEDLEDD